MDFASLAIGLIVGLIAGGLVIFGIIRFLRQRTMKIPTTRSFKDEKKVEQDKVEMARRDLKTLVLEKELLGGALTQVYEAEAEGKITKNERENLASKYSGQLKKVEGKLGDVELLIEVSELENLRTELLGLFERKIGQIESRLGEARVKLDQIKGDKISTEVPTIEKIEDKKVEKRKPKTAEAQVDEKVKAIRDEVLQALARLEQMDIEG